MARSSSHPIAPFRLVLRAVVVALVGALAWPGAVAAGGPAGAAGPELPGRIPACEVLLLERGWVDLECEEAPDGGSPILDYTASVTPELPIFHEGPGNPWFTATNGEFGATYTASIYATNDVGDGPPIEVSFVPRLTRAFVMPDPHTDREYQDFFNRLPTEVERAEWRSDAKTTWPSDMPKYLRYVAGVRLDPVIRLYRTYFLRTPDYAGLEHWYGRRRAGMTLQRIGEHFAASPEFRRRYSALTNRQFMDKVYRDVLGRPGDSAGITYWTQQLDLGRHSRASVMLGISSSTEQQRKQDLFVHLVSVYHAMLRRAPSPTEMDEHLAAFDPIPGTDPHEQVWSYAGRFIGQTLDSDEYYHRIHPS